MEPELFSPEGDRVISTIFEAHEMEELLFQDSEDSFPMFEKVLVFMFLKLFLIV
jgi:hypothetical protein